MRCEQIEVFLTGYLDRELPYQERQKVERHLQECESCRRTLAQLEEVRQSTEQAWFATPTGEEWLRAEHRIAARLSRRLGWLILITWSIMTCVYGLYTFATNPVGKLFEKVLVFGLIAGFGLLFFSVLSQRIHESRGDRYKGVQR